MGISLVKVYKRAWKSVFPTVKRLKRAVKKSRRFPSTMIFFDSAYTGYKFSTRYVKGVPFVNGKNTEEVPFLSKMVYKRVRC